MEITSLFGLPAHPLFVHFPIVLVPVTLVLAVITVAWRRYQRPLGIALLIVAFVAAGSSVLAAGAGEALQEALPDGNEPAIVSHASLGGTARILAVVAFILIAAYVIRMWSDRLRLGPDTSVGRAIRAPWLGAALAVAVLATSVLATAWVVQAGHSGAEAVWQDQWSSIEAPGPR